MTTITTPPLLDQLVAWLDRRFGHPSHPITADTPLFESGLVDSLRVLELIAWTEQAIGREIEDVEIRMDHFRTPADIARVFLAPAERAGAAGNAP